MNAPTTRLHVCGAPVADRRAAFDQLIAAVEGGALPVSAPTDSPAEAMVRRLINEELDRRAAEADAAKRRYEPTLRHCMEAASAALGVAIIDMRSQRKTRPIARARQTAFWLARKVTTRSLPEIGAYFGRNHATIYHGVEAAERRRLDDFDYKELTDNLLSLFIGEA